MFHIRPILFFIILLTIFSCQNSKKGCIIDNQSTVIIHLTPNFKHYSLVNFIYDLHYIKLETDSNSIISDALGIQRIIYKDDKYFILDGKYMEIKVFDSIGKYLYNIGKLGLGRGEFLRVEDMEYYPLRKSLIVLCNNPTKICEFSINGELLKESPLKFFATAFACPNINSRIFYVNQNQSEESEDKNMLLTDSLNKVTYRMFDLPKGINSTIKFSGGLYSTDGNVYFNPAFSNTYYSISNDTAIALYKVDYGPKNIPAGIIEGKLMANLSNYGFQYSTFIKTKDYIGFNYQQERMSLAFFNIHSGNLITSDIKLDSLNMLFKNSVFQCGEKLILVLDVKNLFDFIKRNLKIIHEKFPGLLLNMDTQNSYSNPALFVFSIKSI